MKNTLIFFNINPINLLPIILLSFFYKIVYWKKSNINNFFLKRFQQIYIYESFTQGEWVKKNSLNH